MLLPQLGQGMRAMSPRRVAGGNQDEAPAFHPLDLSFHNAQLRWVDLIISRIDSWALLGRKGITADGVVLIENDIIELFGIPQLTQFIILIKVLPRLVTVLQPFTIRFAKIVKDLTRRSHTVLVGFDGRRRKIASEINAAREKQI